VVNQSNYGKMKEQKVANLLRNRGASVHRSPGSKGAADLKAKFSSGTKWNIQVKSSRTMEPSIPSPKELGRLKQSAAKDKATPVIATVTPKNVTFKSARTNRTLTPPRVRKR